MFPSLKGPPVLESEWVALDLETTGLSPKGDDIIEVGAVRFRGERVLDTFQSFVATPRRLSAFIQHLTGISQADVDGAPAFDVVAARLAAFIGAAPVVGHNVAFDLGFLASNGLTLSNPRCDTWDLAFILLPGAKEYSLGALTASQGIAHPDAHRATADALATQRLFVSLTRLALELESHTLAEVERLAARSGWALAHYFASLAAERDAAQRRNPTGAPASGVGGLDTHTLASRLRQPRALRPRDQPLPVGADAVADLFLDDGPLSRVLPGFEERDEQVAMARAVARAVEQGGRLVVEAGTGVGKSLAYLLPAALYALATGRRVVVSTNTINLQQQLVGKDLPIVADVLAQVEGIDATEFRFAELKGRANYLCMRRWTRMRSAAEVSENEARILAKTLVWLRTSEAGDRGEMNLGWRGTAAVWDRLSSQGAVECPGPGGPCFLRAARERAAASHLVVVNHALLLSDLVAGGALIPSHDALIIDEAHHLEEEATRHLGFEVSQAGLDDMLQALPGERGLLGEVSAVAQDAAVAPELRDAIGKAASQTGVLVPKVRARLAAAFGLAGSFLATAAEQGSGTNTEMRVTSGTRSQPAWSDLEVAWQHWDVALAELEGNLRILDDLLENATDAGLPRYQGLALEVAGRLQAVGDTRARLAEFIPHPKPDAVYWVAQGGREGSVSLRSAPLHVGEQLERLLYSRKHCIVLTSATLSTNRTFDHILDRTGLAEAEEILLGSPFDYPNVALVCVPEDMPEPASRDYAAAVEQAIADAATAADGRTMALFTSHAALQAAGAGVARRLAPRGIGVLVQGVHGPPSLVLDRFMANPRSVLLGTASFWEGVDLAGDSLKVLLLARLPFNVPSEPVFQARSEGYDDPFTQYAVPSAILRLRQGFGRLIRTRSDRGVVVLLDRRVVSRSYGRSFLRSLPPAAFRTCLLGELPAVVGGWLGK